MRKVKLLLLLFAFTIVASCKKENAKPDCEKNNYGTVQVFNNSNDKYDIYIDGVYKTRIGNQGISEKFKITVGNNRKLYAKQVTGFIFTPTIREKFLNVTKCSTNEWPIP